MGKYLRDICQHIKEWWEDGYQLYLQTDCSYQSCCSVSSVSLPVWRWDRDARQPPLFTSFWLSRGNFLDLYMWEKVSASANFSAHCLDVFTTRLSSTINALNRRCLLANNPLDLRFNLQPFPVCMILELITIVLLFWTLRLWWNLIALFFPLTHLNFLWM